MRSFEEVFPEYELDERIIPYYEKLEKDLREKYGWADEER